MQEKIEFEHIAYEYAGRWINWTELEVKLREYTGKYMTIDLDPIESYTELSICGAVWNSRKTDWVTGGQCLDSMLPHLSHSKRFVRLHSLWERWHLNGMNAGTRIQRNFVNRYLWLTGDRYDYMEVCAALQDEGLLTDRKYHYGTAWLVEQLPQDIIQEVRELCG